MIWLLSACALPPAAEARPPRGRGPTADVREVGSFSLRPCEFPSDELPDAEVEIVVDGDWRLVTSNGIPDHAVGTFPNAGNPNRIAEQDHDFRMRVEPTGTGGELRRSRVGVAINGIPLDPGTAEYWQDDPSSGWRYEALSGAIDLGVDCNHGHVQPDGTYHYHGLPTGLATGTAVQHLGWAADGYPLVAADLTPSFRLKAGEREGGPGGEHDGTFVQDWEYVDGAGDLDACNGAELEVPGVGTTYAYVLTETFPFVPRCTVAEQDESFRIGPGPGGPDGRPGPPGHRPPPPPSHRR